MNRSRLYILISLFLYSTCPLWSIDDGWGHIKENNHVKARKAFVETLEEDSLNENAIKGMIFLSEIEQDMLSYSKYSASLIRHYCTEPYYLLFHDQINKDERKKICETNQLSMKSRLYFLFDEANDLKRERKFEEHAEEYDHLINDLNWSFTGPFLNINSYGHEKEFEVEKEPYDAERVFLNHKKKEVRWIVPEYRDQRGIINFDDHLFNEDEGSVFYANTFIDVPDERFVQLRISRVHPIKIWLDNNLIFNQNERINLEFDAEIVQFKITKGYHRLLVKYSEGTYFSGKEGGILGSMNELDEINPLSAFLEQENSSNPGSFRSWLGSSGRLIIRLTDTEGMLMRDITSHSDVREYMNQQYKISYKEKGNILFFQEKIAENPEEWFNYYMLLKAYERYGVTDEVEPYLVHQSKHYSEKTFFKYLLSRVFFMNGKKEKGFEILSKINHEKTPVFSVLFKELNEIDQENEEDKYLSSINRLREVSPSNLKVIKALLNYYDKKGYEDERKKFAQKMIEKYPGYEKNLKVYLKEDYKPADFDLQETDYKEKKKRAKRAAKNIKKRFIRSDYTELIKKYKRKQKEDKVLDLYNELIVIEPSNIEFRTEKAEFLFNLERYNEAIKELKKVIEINPYSGKAYKLIGDIHNDQDEKQEALKYYELAKTYEGATMWFGVSNNDIDEKIEKIRGQKKLKNKFNTRSFNEMLADSSWINKYKDEESVILGYASDLILEPDGNANWYTRMLIKIQTDAGAKSWTEYNFFHAMGNIELVKVVKSSGAEIIPEKNGGFVVFKNLEAGDIIQLEGKMDWKPVGELGHSLIMINSLTFHAPLNYVKIEIALPEDIVLNYKHHKLEDNLEQHDDGEYCFYRWEYDHLPKAVEEVAILDEFDMYANIIFSTIPEWKDIVEWFKAKTYRKLEPDYEIQAILDSIITGSMSTKDQIESIYNYITKEITYSYTPLLQSNFIPKNTGLTCSSKIGDCKDVSTLMLSMLRQLGIESYYVLVKTNNYFHQKIVPSILFNHVITAYVLDGKMHFVDLTSDFYPYYVLNESDVNAWGLVIKEENNELIKLPNDIINPAKNMVIHEIDAKVNMDKSVDITVQSSHSGMKGGHLREFIHNKPVESIYNKILDYMGNGVFESIELVDYHFENPKDITEPLIAEYTFSTKNFMDNALDIYFMKPPYMNGIKSSVAISSKERVNSLDLQQITEICPTLQKITITFPGKLEIKKLPEDKVVKSEFGLYKVSYKKLSRNILYIEKYQEFSKSSVYPEEYASFRKYYLSVLEFDKMKIVLN